jgi:cation diffusion facilitator CzcD-associated flavoprotein CzcO
VRIAVIGAGSAGLAQIKQILDAFSRPGVEKQLELVAFETRDDVGGLW